MITSKQVDKAFDTYYDLVTYYLLQRGWTVEDDVHQVWSKSGKYSLTFEEAYEMEKSNESD